jgi:hypothetical protein
VRDIAVNEQDGAPEIARGVISDLGCLPEAAVLTEDAVARMFGRSKWSVRRAVHRGELPPPTRMFARSVWTAGAIVRHIETRMATAAREAEKLAARISRLSV